MSKENYKEISFKEFLNYLVAKNSEIFGLMRLHDLEGEGIDLYNRLLRKSNLSKDKFKIIFDNYERMEEHFLSFEVVRGDYYFDIDYPKLRRDFAKMVLKVLRKEKIHAGLLKSNGTTSPPNPKNYDAYFDLRPLSYSRGFWDGGCNYAGELYLNFNMDDGTSGKIFDALKKHKINFDWNEREASCFTFSCKNWIEIK